MSLNFSVCLIVFSDSIIPKSLALFIKSSKPLAPSANISVNCMPALPNKLAKTVALSASFENLETASAVSFKISSKALVDPSVLSIATPKSLNISC